MIWNWRRCRRAIVGAMLAGVLIAAAAPGGASADVGGPAGSLSVAPGPQAYLAVGDSIMFGYQLAKVDGWLKTNPPPVPASLFVPNAVTAFSAKLAAQLPGLLTVNYGCPGATTDSFIGTAGCSTYPFPLHDAFVGTQLAAATAFAQTDSVAAITLDLGANDLLGLLQSCGGPTQTACLDAAAPAMIQKVGRNLAIVLRQVRLVAPHARIIVLLLYNPFAAAYPQTNKYVLALDAVTAMAALSVGGRIADAYPAFNLAQPQPQTLCALSLICTAEQDIHPSDAGYLKIGDLFWSAYAAGAPWR